VSNIPPAARKEGLVLRELPEELLVYDLERHKASCLNRMAMATWRRCDGRATVGEIAEALEAELQLPVDEGAVWLALDRLSRAHLLETPVALPDWTEACSRRQWVATVGKVSVALVASVVSILSPTAAAAQSGLITEADCSALTNAQCANQPCTKSSGGKGCGKTSPVCQTSAKGFCRCCT
jgi:hypothetical protein